mgnify:FL=1
MIFERLAIAMKPTRLLLALCLLASVVGCGDSRRRAVEGTVTVDGTPVEYGFIEFLPMEGTSGPTAGAEIKDGAYRVPADKGVFEGEFRVKTRAMRASSTTIYDPVTGEPQQGAEQFLPARYNQQSTLTAEIDGSQTQLEFELTTHP